MKRVPHISRMRSKPCPLSSKIWGCYGTYPDIFCLMQGLNEIGHLVHSRCSANLISNKQGEQDPKTRNSFGFTGSPPNLSHRPQFKNSGIILSVSHKSCLSHLWLPFLRDTWASLITQTPQPAPYFQVPAASSLLWGWGLCNFGKELMHCGGRGLLLEMGPVKLRKH